MEIFVLKKIFNYAERILRYFKNSNTRRDAIKFASIIEVQYKKDSFSRKTDYSTIGSTNRYLNIYMSIKKLELLTNKYNLKLLEFCLINPNNIFFNI